MSDGFRAHCHAASTIEAEPAASRVLVTGTGGPAGVAVVRELARLGEAVVAADIDRHAVGRHLAPRFVVLPRADDPAFVDAVDLACAAHEADAVIATVADELVALAPHRADLAQAGIAVWTPSCAALACSLDKWAFAKALADHEVPAPVTGLGSAVGVPGPWIVKPRFGRGSRSILTTDDPRDLPTLLRLVPDPIVQTRLVGREFSVDCLIDDDGEVRTLAARWRTETRGGIATRGTTFRNDAVLALVRAVVAATGMTTTINLQGFVQPDGSVLAMEVNPRFSGALPLSLAAGADLVGQHLRHLRGRPFELPPAHLGPRWATPGVAFNRYFAEVYVHPPGPDDASSVGAPLPAERPTFGTVLPPQPLQPEPVAVRQPPKELHQ